LEVRNVSATTDDNAKKGRPANVDDVISRGGGTDNEVTLVAFAMLQEARIQVRPILAHDRTTGVFESNILGGADHLMLELHVNDSPWFWDPSCRYCAPGMPHWRYCDVVPNAIALDGTFRSFAVQPSPADQSVTEVVERNSITAEGVATIEGRTVWTGHEAVWMRESWESLPHDAREDGFRRLLPGVIDDLNLTMTDPQDPQTPLQVNYMFTRENVPRADDGRLMLFPPDHLTVHLPVPLEEERLNDIWIPFRFSVRQETTFELPAGFAMVGNLQDKTTIRGPGMSFSCVWNRNDDADLVWSGSLEISTTRIGVEDYDKAVVFLGAVRKALRTGVMAAPVDLTVEAHR
jgi:hypothetical protein